MHYLLVVISLYGFCALCFKHTKILSCKQYVIHPTSYPVGYIPHRDFTPSFAYALALSFLTISTVSSPELSWMPFISFWKASTTVVCIVLCISPRFDLILCFSKFGAMNPSESSFFAPRVNSGFNVCFLNIYVVSRVLISIDCYKL
jgi:hypothetical protein